jgi:hypothetical protein
MSAKKNRFDKLFQKKLFRITKAKKHPSKVSQRAVFDLRSMRSRAEATPIPDQLFEVTLQRVIESNGHPNTPEFRERLRSMLRDFARNKAA